jgi:pilus assembly protein CpaF
VIHVERSRQGRHVACIGVVEDGDNGLEVTVAVAVHAGTVTFGPAWLGLSHRLGLDVADVTDVPGGAGPEASA